MSSDTFRIEIRAIEGDSVELLCTTSTAGGLNDFACSRSFALMAIEDNRPYAKTSPLQQAMAATAEGNPPVWEESYHREHVAKFIASTELVERIGIIDDEGAWARGREANENDDAVPERDYPLHQFVLRVRMTDPRFLEGVSVGDRYGTTAFDAWWDDPTRPSRAVIDEVSARASRWTGPGSPR